MGIGGVVKPGFYRDALPQNPKQKQSQQDAAKSEEAQLAIAQLHELAEAAPPAPGRHERQEAFDHQDQRQRAPEYLGAHEKPPGAQRRGALPAGVPAPCMARKKSDEGSTTITSLFLLKLCL